MKFPKNKFARLAINIISVVICFFLGALIHAWIGSFCMVIENRGAYYTYPLCALNGIGRLSIGIPF